MVSTTTKKTKTAMTRFSCENCVAIFNSMTSLNDHKNFICGKEESFQCSKCDQKFFMKKFLGTHLKKKHHIYDKNYDQYVVKLAVTSKSSPQLQNEEVESGNKMFPCRVCEKMFPSSAELMMHNCGKEISFKCSICEQKFFARPRVYTHVKSVHKIKHNDFKEYDKYVIKIDPAAELAAAIKNIPRSDDSEDEESDEEKIKCDNEKCQVEFDSTADLNIHIKNRGKKKIVKLHTCQRCYFVSCAKKDFDAHVKKASCKRVDSPEQLDKTRPTVTKKQSSKKTKMDDLEADNNDEENADSEDSMGHKSKKPKLNTSKVRPVVTKKQSSKKTKMEDLEHNDDEDKNNSDSEDLMKHESKKSKLNTSKVMTREINGLDDL